MRGAKLFNLQSLEQLRALLVRFFYLDRIYSATLSEVWEELYLLRQAFAPA